MWAKLLQLCLTLCNPMDCCPPGSSVHGILQGRILEWITTSSSRGSPQPRDRTRIFYISCIGRRVLYHWCHLVSPKQLYPNFKKRKRKKCKLSGPKSECISPGDWYAPWGIRSPDRVNNLSKAGRRLLEVVSYRIYSELY